MRRRPVVSGPTVSAAPAGRHFVLEPLADGVWAAVHRAGGWAVGNAGIVDLGGATLVFDAGMTPEAGEELAAAARALTGRAPTQLLLSHYHNDHLRGFQAFPDAPLIASEATRTLVDTRGREELTSDLEHGAARLEETRALTDDGDPVRRATARTFVPYWEALVATAPRVALRLPEVTFEGRMRFHGARRRADFLSLGAGHTPDDAVLLLPDDGVVFCGDLLFVASHPYLADGDPEGWLRALGTLKGMGAVRYVPGHGPVGTAADLEVLSAHIRGLLARAETLHRQGVSAADLADPRPDDASLSWDFAFPFYRSNVRFLLRRLEG
jgi:glyoxylase-like metal-dependent hydrolase (beta-lactamase superfamily II)